MRVRSVLGNRQLLDGGAMFGNVPRALWSRWCPPDDRGRIALACRAALIEHEGRQILLETGIGACFEPKLRDRYGVDQAEHVLLESLASHGLEHADVDVVVLSHLHFDHAGGLLAPYREGARAELLFPRARFVVGEGAWQRALKPHLRDRASFLPELAPLLEASGRLELVRAGDVAPSLGNAFTFRESHGHTPGMLHTWVHGATGSLFFCADLVPGVPWVHLPVTMGYDRSAELLIDEKAALYPELADQATWLFFTHDTTIAAARLRRVDDGRWSTGDELRDAELVLDLDAA